MHKVILAALTDALGAAQYAEATDEMQSAKIQAAVRALEAAVDEAIANVGEEAAAYDIMAGMEEANEGRDKLYEKIVK